MTKDKINGLEELPTETSKALIRAGYKSLKAIAIALPIDLSEDTGISEQKAEEIISIAVSKVAVPPLRGKDLLEIEQKKGKVTTGSDALDDLLGSGIWTGEITEISGGFSTGKTQLCFQLCVNAQLPLSEGGLGGKVFFIDSEGTFSATRVGEMAIAMDMDPHEVLDNIMVARALDSHHQIRLVQKINEVAERENIRLIIVDSIASHFRSDYIGKDKMAERQQRIMQHASSLTNLAFLYDIAIVVTNQMVLKVDQLSGSSEMRPALGEAWSHRPQTRLVIRKSPARARVARLTDSPRKPENEEVFYITSKGIRDTPR